MKYILIFLTVLSLLFSFKSKRIIKVNVSPYKASKFIDEASYKLNPSMSKTFIGYLDDSLIYNSNSLYLLLGSKVYIIDDEFMNKKYKML